MSQQALSQGATSVLPKVHYEQMVEGVRLSNVGTSRLKAIVLLLVSLVVLGLIGGWVFLSLRATSDRLVLIAPGLFGCLALAFFVFALRRMLVASAFGPAELFVDNIPLSLGQTVNIRYRCPIHGNFNVTSVSGSLICQEWVRYKVGTDTRIATEQLCSLDLPSPERFISPLGGIDVAWTITIPPNMPPSFEVTNNAIKWVLRISVQVEKYPDPNIEMTLPIQPEVIR
jgi:hypothetical protein